MTQQNPFQWEHPKALDYNDTIRRRILGYDTIFQLMADLVQVNNPNPKKFLVVGAGGGQELCTFIPTFPSAHYVAVDPSENMLHLAKLRLAEEQLNARVDYYTEELQNVVFQEKFDVATCHLVLHFLQTTEQKKSLIEVIAQNLAPGGRAFFSSFNTDLDDAHDEKMMQAWGIAMLRNGVTEKQWLAFKQSFGDTLIPVRTEDMTELFEQAGFTNIKLYFKAYSIEAFCMEKK